MESSERRGRGIAIGIGCLLSLLRELAVAQGLLSREAGLFDIGWLTSDMIVAALLVATAGGLTTGMRGGGVGGAALVGWVVGFWDRVAVTSAMWWVNSSAEIQALGWSRTALILAVAYLLFSWIALLLGIVGGAIGQVVRPDW